MRARATRVKTAPLLAVMSVLLATSLAAVPMAVGSDAGTALRCARLPAPYKATPVVPVLLGGSGLAPVCYYKPPSKPLVVYFSVQNQLNGPAAFEIHGQKTPYLGYLKGTALKVVFTRRGKYTGRMRELNGPSYVVGYFTVR